MEGERVGLVAASFDLTKIQHKLMVSNVPKHSVVSVFDDNGVVIVRSSSPDKWVGADVHDKPVFKLMNGKSEGDIEDADFVGQEKQPLGNLTISLGIAAYPSISYSAPNILQ